MGWFEEDIEPLKIACRMLFLKSEDPGGVGRTAEHLRTLDERYADHKWIQALLSAVRASMNGIHGRARETQRRDNPFKNPVK